MWCSGCKRAVAWSLMTDAESPRTLFELLYLYFGDFEKLRIVYDNACNFLAFCLNRDAEWSRRLRTFVDALHWQGHTGCSANLNTGTFLRCLIGQLMQVNCCIVADSYLTELCSGQMRCSAATYSRLRCTLRALLGLDASCM